MSELCPTCVKNDAVSCIIALIGLALACFAASGERAIAGAILVLAMTLNDPKGIHHNAK